MPAHISDLALPQDLKSNYKVKIDKINEDDDMLGGLSKVNIFIGPNNSGKSRFLRGIFKETIIGYAANRPLYNEIVRLHKEKIEKIRKTDFIKFKEGIDGISELEARDVKEILSVPINVKFSSTHPERLTSQIRGINNQFYTRIDKFYPNESPNKYDIGRKNDFFNKSIRKEIEKVTSLFSCFNTYIPMIRGLRTFIKDDNGVNQDFYENRILNDYFENLKNKINNPDSKLGEHLSIFTGISMFEEVRKRLLGNWNERNMIRDLENLISEQFFNNQPFSLIPKLGKDILTFKIGDEKERSIVDLGDGLQQIAIMTFPVFMREPSEKVLLFIEEPELYLHPGFQRQLMEIFLHHPRFDNVQVFMTSHSNHLLDLTLDMDNISVYRFEKKFSKSEQIESTEKEPKFSIELCSNDDRRLLQDLGVNNSSVMLSNCTIWVEGITDRHYIRKYLEIYQQARQSEENPIFKEDIHFSFVEYGGNNITHYSFLDKEEKPIDVERVCGRLILITDKDEGKDKRHAELKEVLKNRVFCLECREIENSLTKEILLAVVEKYEKRDSEKHKNTENKIKTEFDYDSYKDEYLGTFIESKIIKPDDSVRPSKKDKNGEKHPYKESSGTIKDKLGFSAKAIDYMNDVIKNNKDDVKKNMELLSEPAQALCKKIYDFIKDNNKNMILSPPKKDE